MSAGRRGEFSSTGLVTVVMVVVMMGAGRKKRRASVRTTATAAVKAKGRSCGVGRKLEVGVPGSGYLTALAGAEKATMKSLKEWVSCGFGG